MKQQTLNLPHLFQKAFGPGVTTDEALHSYLTHDAEGLACALGEEIPAGSLRSGYKRVLLQGKVRVLSQQGATRKTLTLLEQGDIWDDTLHSPDNLVFRASSDTWLCDIPTSLVSDNPVLMSQWLATMHKLDARYEPALVPMQPVQNGYAAETVPVKTPAHSTSDDAFKAMLRHFHEPPDRLTALNKKPLPEALQAWGYQVTPQSRTWQQLLNAEFPFLLEDHTGIFYWMTGRQGNTLITLADEAPDRFYPAQLDNQQTFRTYTITPPVAKKKTNTTPYSFRWYVNLYAQNGLLSFQMIVSSVIVQVLSLGIPVFYFVIFDRVFGRQNLSTLNIMSVGILLVMLFDITVRQLRQYVLSHQLERIDRAALDNYLDWLFALPLSKLTAEKMRHFTERFGDLLRVNQALTSTLLLSSLDAIFSILLIAFLMMLHVQMACIALASIIPIGLLTFLYTPLIKKRAERFMLAQRQQQMRLGEVLQHAETVQSINAGVPLRQQIDRELSDWLAYGGASRQDQAGLANMQNFFASLGTIATLFFGAHEVLSGVISYGVYMAINMLSRSVVGTMQKLFAAVLQFQEARVGMEQLAIMAGEIPETETAHAMQLQTVQGNIAFHDVRFRYDPQAPWALQDVNLNIHAGTKVVITGKSGAGKSTLIRLLQRLYEPSGGFITLDGYNIADIAPVNLREHVGVAAQKSALFAGTIRENLLLAAPDASPQALAEAAAWVDLDRFLNMSPHGFDTPVAPMGSNLSGGQAAQIALARILLKHPSVLVLDETLSPLDLPLQTSILGRLLERFATCVLVTDNMVVHQRADWIIVLHEGRVVEQGTLPQLIKAKGYYYHLHPVESMLKSHS